MNTTLNTKMNLKDYLQENLLVGDGAIATWLYQFGIPVGICYEELCLSKPEMVKQVHAQYYAAGARLLETNTFSANREALSRYGLEQLVYPINWQAVKLAREASGPDAYVVGSMTSLTGGRVWDAKMAGQQEMFAEQANALLAGGVDGLILETFLDLEELVLALETVRSLTALPIITQLACLEVGRTRDGYSLTEAFRQLQHFGADVVGLNCRLGPAEILRSIEQSVIPEGLPISVFPNAGRLGVSDGEYAYTSSPRYFADQALRFREQGVRLIGGCCGTTPAHIEAVAETLRGLSPVARINPAPTETGEDATKPGKAGKNGSLVLIEPGLGAGIESIIETETETEIEIETQRTKTILDKLAERPVVIVEFDPPKDLDLEDYLHGALNLSAAGTDAITMADNSLAQIRMSNLALGAIVKHRLGIDPLIHITCRDRNLLGQQSHLMGLHALGINQVLVITGDPARFGDLPGSSSVFDVSSFDLIRMVKQLNNGISFSGKPLKQKAKFVVGAAFNPHVNKFENALDRLEKKIAAGADFIMTQPVYDAEMIERIYEKTKVYDIPIFLGIMPLTSSRNAEFLHNEVPGIRLSEEALERMRKYTGEEARREGLEMAKELTEVALRYFRGIYVITPFNYHEISAELVRFVRHLGDSKLIADRPLEHN